MTVDDIRREILAIANGDFDGDPFDEAELMAEKLRELEARIAIEQFIRSKGR